MAVPICTDANVLKLIVTHFNQDIHCYLLLVEDILEAAESDVVEELGNAEVLEADDGAGLFCDESLLTTIPYLTTSRYAAKCTLNVLFQSTQAKHQHCNKRQQKKQHGKEHRHC